jgi:hypothetical protein
MNQDISQVLLAGLAYQHVQLATKNLLSFYLLQIFTVHRVEIYFLCLNGLKRFTQKVLVLILDLIIAIDFFQFS